MAPAPRIDERTAVCFPTLGSRSLEGTLLCSGTENERARAVGRSFGRSVGEKAVAGEGLFQAAGRDDGAVS